MLRYTTNSKPRPPALRMRWLAPGSQARGTMRVIADKKALTQRLNRIQFQAWTQNLRSNPTAGDNKSVYHGATRTHQPVASI